MRDERGGEWENRRIGEWGARSGERGVRSGERALSSEV